MLADLGILVPSRGRPENLARFITAVHATAELDFRILIGLDDDEPKPIEYEQVKAQASDKEHFMFSERKNLVQWTNLLAKTWRGQFRYFASLGDDMVPRTKGWDKKLVDAIEEDFGGIGISYPWDGVRDDIPEAYVLSSEIPDVLGWVMYPKLNHWYNDNVIADLGYGASCIRQLRGVVVDHNNVGMGKAPVDQTALDQGAKITEDKAIYENWFLTERLADVQKVKDITRG